MSSLENGESAAAPLLEVCVETSDACEHALRSGASRIELCSRLDLGGMSPSLELVKEVMQKMSLVEGHKSQLPLMIMVRLSGPSFIYSDHTVDLMCDYIDQVKFLNSQMLEEASSQGSSSITSYFMGFVFGCTEYDSVAPPMAPKEPPSSAFHQKISKAIKVDEPSLVRLVSKSRPFSITFHRAFDEITDKIEALTVLWRCKVDRILTSGGEGGTVENHIPSLQQLVALASTLNKEEFHLPKSLGQDRSEPKWDPQSSAETQLAHCVTVMPGGGVRPHNAQLLISFGAQQLHSSVPFNLPAVLR